MEYLTFDPRAVRRYGVADLVAIVATVWAGSLHHGNDPLVVPSIYIETLTPFLVGWVVAAYALGAYSEDTLSGYRAALVPTLVGWFVGNAIGQGLRASPFFRGGTELSFFLVMFGFVGVALLVARTLVIAVRGSRAG